jgi:hypothetical protein
MEDQITDPGMRHIGFEKSQVVVALGAAGPKPADDFDELVPSDVRNPETSRPGSLRRELDKAPRGIPDQPAG